jgi:hypothetical protein
MSTASAGGVTTATPAAIAVVKSLHRLGVQAHPLRHAGGLHHGLAARGPLMLSNVNFVPATPANTTVVTQTASAAVPSAVSVPPQVMTAPAMPAPPQVMALGPLADVTLSKADVASLKSTVDTFATNYTSGTDATADKAAVAALEAGLKALSQNVWSETHVVDAATVAKLQQAVDGFAQSYTSGADVSKDSAAWQSLQTGLGDFSKSVMAASSAAASSTTSGTTTTTATASAPSSPPVAPPMFFGARLPHEVWTTGSTSESSNLLDNVTLTKDQVTTIQTAVDTFATSYTSGTDAAKDQAASAALRTSLASVFSSVFASSTTGTSNTASPGQIPFPAYGRVWGRGTLMFGQNPGAGPGPVGMLALHSAQGGAGMGTTGWWNYGPGGPKGIGPGMGIG